MENLNITMNRKNHQSQNKKTGCKQNEIKEKSSAGRMKATLWSVTKHAQTFHMIKKHNS